MSTPLYFLLGVVGFALMIVSNQYCDRVAEKHSWNAAVARLVGLLLPVVGPLIYWILDRRSRTKPG
jgi:hypothetical protein